MTDDYYEDDNMEEKELLKDFLVMENGEYECFECGRIFPSTEKPYENSSLLCSDCAVEYGGCHVLFIVDKIGNKISPVYEGEIKAIIGLEEA